MEEERLYFTLPNGIKVMGDSLTHTADQYAEQKGLKGVRVFKTVLTNGIMQYFIAQDGEPVFTSENIAEIGAHIDIMHLRKDYT